MATVDVNQSRYDAHRQRMAENQRRQVASGQEIGPLPRVADPARKESCRLNFRLFCETYDRSAFYLGWSDDHLKVIARIEDAILRGGTFAMAMPRGSGKTTLSERAATWALLYGHRRFVVLLGSGESAALTMLESIKMELETNDMLLADFPEVCYPIVRLEHSVRRAEGQRLDGVPTRIGWTSHELILPTVAGSPASGAMVRAFGITAHFRGTKYTNADGEVIRPDLVIPDDPQTDESARSISQCATREKLLAGAVLGLAGPGKKISGIMPCTVIRRGDMADSILDRQKNPRWQGERMKMVYDWPTDTKLWDQYADLRAEGLRAGRGIAEATEFYKLHRETMDAGSRVAWEARFNPDELSALQSAWNLRLDNEATFFAEYQNEPLPDVPSVTIMTADEIEQKTNGHARGIVPQWCNRVTCFIDVQLAALYWMVCAWGDDFSGAIIDYGTWPQQNRRLVNLRDVRQTLSAVYSKKTKGSVEGAIYGGLTGLADHVLAPCWKRDDGAELRVERCLVDANWGASTEVVYQFCRQSAYANVLLPSHGKYVGAATRPLNDAKGKRGDRLGLNWRIPFAPGKHSIRHAIYDTNYWKSFAHARLSVELGARGSLSLYDAGREGHEVLCQQLVSEYPVTTVGRGRTIEEWRMRPEASDNHELDCLAGNCVGASIEGVTLKEAPSEPGARKSIPVSERPTLAQLAGRK